MSEKYKIFNPDNPYFLTMTVVGWIDAFTKNQPKLIVVDSLKFCQQNKGLIIFGWCLMINHLHLLAKSDGSFTLSDIIRDFKKFTARRIITHLQDHAESRKEWMLCIL